MATGDPRSPSYTSPNGVTEQQRADLGLTPVGASAPQPEAERSPEETPGEKIGRFFRRAMERLSGHDEDEWRRGNERNDRDRDTQDRYRTGDRSWQYGRSALRERGTGEWRDAGRSQDDRNLGNRGGPSGETGGSDERLRMASGTAGYGQGGSAAPGSSRGQGGYEREESQLRSGHAPSFENRGQSLGQRSPVKSPSESHGMSEDRGDQLRDVMTRNPRTVTRQSEHREAAAIMRDENCGVVPVVDSAGRLEGILTDRDIVVRGVAHDRARELRIEDV